MKITGILLIALVMDAFLLFGIPALMPGAGAQPLEGHLLGKFVVGDMAHPDELEMNKTGISAWVNLVPQGAGIISDVLSTLVSVIATIAIFITFAVDIVIGLIAFPFTLFTTYLPNSPVFAVLIGAIYVLVNTTALITLASGRDT